LEFLKHFLSILALQGAKQELIFPVVFQYELDTTAAEVADSVEQYDFLFIYGRLLIYDNILLNKG
jgi:hypothetical protein